MDSALPPRTAPFGHLLGRVVDARTCFRIHCIPRAATSIARAKIRSIEAEFFQVCRHLLPLSNAVGPWFMPLVSRAMTRPIS